MSDGFHQMKRAYRCEYNQLPPHSRLGYQSPERFAVRERQADPSFAPVGLRPPYTNDGQTNNPPLNIKAVPKN